MASGEPMLKKLLNGEALSQSEEAALVASLAPKGAQSLADLVPLLLSQRRRLHRDLAQARELAAAAEARLAGLAQTPLLPARVVRALGSARVDVVTSGRRLIAAPLPELAGAPFHPGDEVLLDGQGAVVVERLAGRPPTGLVGTVEERQAESVLLRGPGDEEILAAAPPELAAQLGPGDRVLYLADLPFVLGRLPPRARGRYELEQVPDVTFDRIGGLDDVVAELRRDLDLHLRHPEIAAHLESEAPRGVLLVGPPGVGKTMIAKAVANHLAREGSGARFLSVKPGELRGPLYGQTEARLRGLFGEARRFPGAAVVFFDELDTFGTRGEGLGLDIDSRVMPALLAELDGLVSAGNVLCIGATNRLDLCDPALVRHGRMLDRVYPIPRPGREATRAILARHLGPGVPCADGGRAVLLDAATSHLFAPAGGAGTLATLTFADGQQRALRPADLVCGALLASAIGRAKHAAGGRALEARSAGLPLEEVLGSDAIRVRIADLLEALDAALDAEVEKVRTPQVARRVLTVDRAEEIVRVEVARRSVSRHRFLRAA